MDHPLSNPSTPDDTSTIPLPSPATTHWPVIVIVIKLSSLRTRLIAISDTT